jgi:NCAIR mutase (PurE)-related protein
MNDDADSEVLFDYDRRRRTGLDEAVLADGKSTAQLDVIFASARARGVPLLVTRLSAATHAALAVRWPGSLDYCAVSRTAFFEFEGDSAAAAPPRVAIVAGGSSDAAVAREAARTLAFNQVASTAYIDVGVAGLWRLTRHLDAIAEFPVVIAVAGMDAALPTVMGGLIPGLVIAVPTSVGYGVAAGGHCALHALLASCAPGICVVNIDNGYGAACAALRALRALRIAGAGRAARSAATAGATARLA